MSVNAYNEELNRINAEERAARFNLIQERAAAARAASARDGVGRLTRSMAARAPVAPSYSVAASADLAEERRRRFEEIQERAASARQYNMDALVRGNASQASIDAVGMNKPYRCAQNARGDFRFTADEIRTMAKKNGIPEWQTTDLDTLCKQMGIFNDMSLASYRALPAMSLSTLSTPGEYPSAPLVASVAALPAVSVSRWDKNLPRADRRQLAMNVAPSRAKAADSASNPYQCNTKARGANRFTRAELDLIAKRVGMSKEEYSKMTMDQLCEELGIYNDVSVSYRPPVASSSDDYKYSSSVPIVGYASAASSSSTPDYGFAPSAPSSSSSTSYDWSQAEDAGVYPSAPSSSVAARPASRRVPVVNPGEPRRSPIKRVRQDYSGM